ncbi:MAG TPA: hypothetical protein VJN18_23370 [Polyangiaceae bacterium]|nr:hypothetical protein [Polyangiaceae bacterium]
MSKAILLSIVLSLLVIPALAARDPAPRKGLRKVFKYTVAFQAFYAFALIYLWGRW